MPSLTRTVADRLRGIGYEIVRAAESGGLCRLDGVAGWYILCDEVGDVASAAAALAQLGNGGQAADVHPAVAVQANRSIKVLVLLVDLVAANGAIQMAASANKAARAAANRVAARGEEVVKTIPCGRERLRGCLLPLEDWLDLLLSWRVVTGPRRSLPPLPQAEGLRVGARWIAYDYHAVRLAQIEEETDRNVRRGGARVGGGGHGE